MNLEAVRAQMDAVPLVGFRVTGDRDGSGATVRTAAKVGKNLPGKRPPPRQA